jgi:integrase
MPVKRETETQAQKHKATKARQHAPDIKFRNAKPKAKQYKITDGLGLYMLVHPSGGRYWRMKYRYEGKEKAMAFGVYPDVSLEAARKKRDDARVLIADGQDPMGVAAEIADAKKQERDALAVEAEKQAMTFETLALDWYTYTEKLWSRSHAHKLMRRLELHIFPVIGATPVGKIDAAAILECCKKSMAAGNLETAQGIKITCGQAMKYAVKLGHAQFNPTSVLTPADIPLPIVTNMAAMTTPADLARLMRAVNDYPYPIVRAAHLLMAYTFQRGVNIRQMKWEDINFETALWTIPSVEMKRTLRDKLTGEPHLVPLVPQAIKAIEAMRELSGSGRYVLPSPRANDLPLSNNAMNAALRSMGFTTSEVTSHGYRATAKTLLREEFDVADELIEAQQAHKVKDALGAAYNRTKFIARRRTMLETWANYIDSLMIGNVLPFSRTA